MTRIELNGRGWFDRSSVVRGDSLLQLDQLLAQLVNSLPKLLDLVLQFGIHTSSLRTAFGKEKGLPVNG